MRLAPVSLIAFLISVPAFAGPTIIESGGYTFLPGLTLTKPAGLNVVKLNSGALICFDNTTCSFTAGVSAGALTFTGAAAFSNATTFSAAATFLAAAQTTQGQKLTFDGATGAKYFTSDGSTLSLTGLVLRPTAGEAVEGDISGYTTIGTTVLMGTHTFFPGVWLLGGTVTPSLSNYSLLLAGQLILNGPSAQGLVFRENNGTLGSWNAASGLVIGSAGTGISSSVAGSATLDFASAPTDTCSADLTISITGSVAGSPCMVGAPNGSVATGSSFTCWVSANGTVKVRHCCSNAGGSCDPASGTFQARVFNP